MPEIQRADPSARRRALVACAVIAVAGWGVYVALGHWIASLRGLDVAHQRAALESALVWGTWAATAPVGLYAAWVWRYGSRVQRAGRFPPPGTKVIRDTPVLHGRPARLRGTLLKVLAACLGIFCAGTLLAVYRLVARLHA